MVDQDAPDPQFDAMTSRLLRREALRRAAEETLGRASVLVLLHDATSSSARTDPRLPTTDADVD
jgi:hypothetical protein